MKSLSDESVERSTQVVIEDFVTDMLKNGYHIKSIVLAKGDLLKFNQDVQAEVQIQGHQMISVPVPVNACTAAGIITIDEEE